MNDQLFSTNRLNRRIIVLIGYLTKLSQDAAIVAETNTAEAASNLLDTLEHYSAEADSMAASLETLIRETTGQTDESGSINVDARVSENGVEL